LVLLDAEMIPGHFSQLLHISHQGKGDTRRHCWG